MIGPPTQLRPERSSPAAAVVPTHAAARGAPLLPSRVLLHGWMWPLADAAASGVVIVCKARFYVQLGTRKRIPATALGCVQVDRQDLSPEQVNEGYVTR